MPKARWSAICKDCAGASDSLIELLQGRFSKGVMARICQDTTGLFTLRNVDRQDLIAKAGTGLPRKGTGPSAAKVLASENLSEMFGIDMAPPAAPKRTRGAAPAGMTNEQ